MVYMQRRRRRTPTLAPALVTTPPTVSAERVRALREKVARRAALTICGSLLITAPLLFGSVDRVFQIALTLLLGTGVLIAPPVIIWPRGWVRAATLFPAGLILFKEFGPASLFGATSWRMTLSQSFAVVFPWTHNPEPGRALDALLSAAIAGVWFIWVRSLAAKRENRVVIAWTLLLAAATLAIVCFAMGQSSSSMIYGIRETPGWRGYGPFPNRNHTACFLAMGAMMGCGMITRAAARKNPAALSFSIILLGLIFVAMLWSGSRGGLMAFGAGFLIFGVICIAKAPGWKGIAAAVGGLLIVGTLLLAFGSTVTHRFGRDSDLQTNLRWDVWKDTLSMWKDAPLLGHGLGTFPQIIPIYQTMKLEDQVILHPESSWLGFLAELGALPLFCLAAGLLVFLWRNVSAMFSPHRPGFHISAACVAAACVLLIHSFWDVPAHRWPTAGYALAALAIACPTGTRKPPTAGSRKLAFLPFAIGLLWTVPLLCGWPPSSPVALAGLLNRTATTTGVGVPELERSLRLYPLSPDLHEAIGVREIQSGDAESAWSHFRIADRLRPSIWELPAEQAEASQNFSRGMAFHFWTLAIERSGHRAAEVLDMACRETTDIPGAASFWNAYVETNPSLCLRYAQQCLGEKGRRFYNLWWAARGLNPTPEQYEVDDFYRSVLKWGTEEQFSAWMKVHPDWQARDYKEWASSLHYWGKDDEAWKVLSEVVKEPEYPVAQTSGDLPHLETRWSRDPSDFLNAQQLAGALLKTGNKGKSGEIVIGVARAPGAPEWFINKAAYVEAANQHYKEAVSTLLRAAR